MTFPLLLLWGLIGIILAFVSLKTQIWTAIRITPARPKQGVLLVIGGACLRWIITGIVLVFALSHSISAMLLVFGGFIVSRTLFLCVWQDALIQNPLRANQIKD